MLVIFLKTLILFVNRIQWWKESIFFWSGIFRIQQDRRRVRCKRGRGGTASEFIHKPKKKLKKNWSSKTLICQIKKYAFLNVKLQKIYLLWPTGGRRGGPWRRQRQDGRDHQVYQVKLPTAKISKHLKCCQLQVFASHISQTWFLLQAVLWCKIITTCLKFHLVDMLVSFLMGHHSNSKDRNDKNVAMKTTFLG